MRRREKKIRLLEFIIIGIAFGVFEDLLAISLATDASIELSTIFIVLIVAIPFAFISEIVVDHPRFWERIFPNKRQGENY